MGLREDFLRLLEQDKDFRMAVAGHLGYSEILERLDRNERLIARLQRQVAKLQKQVDKMQRQVDKLQEQVAKMQEQMRKMQEQMDKLLGLYGQLAAEVAAVKTRLDKLEKKVEVTIGTMGRRWGRDLELAVLEIFREALEERGIEPGRVEKLRFKDVDGRYTGTPGRVFDIDVVARGGGLYAIEVKSYADVEDVEVLHDKIPIVERYHGRKVDKAYLVAVAIEKEAVDRAKELGIEVIYGSTTPD
ncbi:PD-(D/E)XK nuclease family protein [Pyrobaculum ferrireducens]|uniref:Microtubule binding protein, putative n=1 Tax=Pyrobaculum ferrireducens TaxID=1104324 RepID=G7VBF0_9CREN|nr:DUF3782 domain-containing protein [Pyrobaculum ferrireducens]AET32380.1 Microtubule binding protein, putative [Pyrobaculum ferrireducens]